MNTLQRRWARVKGRMNAEPLPAEGAYADAVELWEAVYGYSPDEWQRDILLSKSPRVLMCCSRQVGKSTVSAIIALWTLLYEAPALVLAVSASLRQAQELGRTIFDGYRALGKPVPAEAENRLSLELSSGSRLVCLPAKEATIRGLAGAKIILVDEAARVPGDLYHALRPMVAVSEGRLIALSTPAGKVGWFFEAWEYGEAWQRVRVTAEQCPRISAAFLQEERRALPSWIYASEYDALFTDTLTQIFRTEDVEAALSDEVLPFPRRRSA